MSVWNSTTSCPSSESDIMIRGLSLGCQDGREYHCLVDHNGVPGEICVSRTWVEPEKCSEYNADAGKLDVYICNKEHGTCPPKVYWSNTSFQYSGCMYFKTTQTNTTEASAVSIDHSNSIMVMPVVLGIVVTVIVMMILTCIAVWIYRRKLSREGENSPGEDHNPLGHAQIPLLELNEDMILKGQIALEEHNQDITYVPTQGFIWTTEVILKHNVAVISGIVGSGKTKTAIQTASTWKQEDEHRRLILIESVNEISNVLQRKLENVIVVIDDCFTRWTLECTEGSLSSTCAELYRRVVRSRNVKLIVTIDHNVYQRHNKWLSRMDLFKKHLVITLPIEMAGQVDFARKRPKIKELLQNERKMILQSHIENQNSQEYYVRETKSQSDIALNDIDIHKIISSKYTTVGFPSVCAIFVRLHLKAALNANFFEDCDTLIGNLMEMKTEGVKGKQTRCILSYAMLRDRCIDLNELDLGLLDKLWEGYRLEPYNFQMVTSIVKEMSKTFLIQTKNTIFRIAYTAVYNKNMQHWIYRRPHDFLELCNITPIKELVRPDGYQPKTDEQPIFVVKEAAHTTHLAQRFKDLLPMHPELKHHPMMSNKDFQNEMEKDEKKQKFADDLYDYYDSTYEEIKDSGKDPETSEAEVRPLPPPPKKDKDSKGDNI